MNQKALQQLIDLHHWESENLPLFRKSIGQSVVLRLLDAFLRSECLSVKELTLSLPFSTSGIRLQLRMLENEGWIEFVPSSDDQRVKVIKPSASFTRVLGVYQCQCVKAFEVLTKTI